MLSNLLSREWTFGHRSRGITGLFGLVFSLVQSFCWLAFVSSTRKLQSCDCIIQCKISQNTHILIYTFKYAANVDSFPCKWRSICSGCMNSRDTCPILYILAENWNHIYFTQEQLLDFVHHSGSKYSIPAGANVDLCCLTSLTYYLLLTLLTHTDVYSGLHILLLVYVNDWQWKEFSIQSMCCFSF